MSGDGKRGSEEHGALTAAEYVLGVLDADSRRVAERRLESDPAFAREVLFWESRFAPLAEALPPVTPPARFCCRASRSPLVQQLL
jgi:anti-sigma-K factor RskA